MEPSPAAICLLGSVSLFIVHLNVFFFLTTHTDKTGFIASRISIVFAFYYNWISSPLAVPPENLGPRVRTYKAQGSGG